GAARPAGLRGAGAGACAGRPPRGLAAARRRLSLRPVRRDRRRARARFVAVRAASRHRAALRLTATPQSPPTSRQVAAAYNACPRPPAVPVRFPDYDFSSHHLEVRPGIRMHYLDEGPRDGEVVVMVHGNPSWSYYWRHLVNGLRGRYRCIVPDHVGMGLSDKPDDAANALPRYDYTLQSRVDDLGALLAHLGIDGLVTLAVHDWGGMIGVGWALSHIAQVQRLVVRSTAAFPMPAGKPMPWQIALGRDYNVGELVIRGFNAFSGGASRLGVERRMPAEVRRAYVAPYDSWKN